MSNGDQLVSLIVGETPTTQFVSWRLSLSKTFLIQVSEYISGDGIISWKSNKYGSNFYTPNVFAKNLNQLYEMIVDENRCLKYTIDIVVISANSKSQYLEIIPLLQKIISPSCLFVVDCNFGVNLDKLILEQLEQQHCPTVISLLCDIECRKLATGSYALVSEMCNLYFGLTYQYSNKDNDLLECKKILFDNRELLQKQYMEKESTLNLLIEMLCSTEIKNIFKIPLYSNEMALKVWRYIIPKIAFNTLSIVFEDPNYELFDDPKDFPRTLSEDVLKELVTIAQAHCGKFLTEYCLLSNSNIENGSSNDFVVDYDKVFEVVKTKCKELNTFTISEAPEYLTLSFEAYSFFHKIEYPASLLLSQPISLADSYGKPKLGIKFLFGFYSKLSTLAGIPLDRRGTLKEKINLLGGRSNVSSLLNQRSNTEKDKQNLSPHDMKSHNIEKKTSDKSNSLVKNNKKTKQKLKKNSNYMKKYAKECKKNDSDIILTNEFSDLYLSFFTNENVSHLSSSKSDGFDLSPRLSAEMLNVNYNSQGSKSKSDIDFDSDSSYYTGSSEVSDSSYKSFKKNHSAPSVIYDKSSMLNNQREKQQEKLVVGTYLYDDPYTEEVTERNLFKIQSDGFQQFINKCNTYGDFGRYDDSHFKNLQSPKNSVGLSNKQKEIRKNLLNRIKLYRKKKVLSNHPTFSNEIKHESLGNLRKVKSNYMNTMSLSGIDQILDVSSGRFGHIEIGPQLSLPSELKMRHKGDYFQKSYLPVTGNFKTFESKSDMKLIEFPVSRIKEKEATSKNDSNKNV